MSSIMPVLIWINSAKSFQLLQMILLILGCKKNVQGYVVTFGAIG